MKGSDGMTQSNPHLHAADTDHRHCPVRRAVLRKGILAIVAILVWSLFWFVVDRRNKARGEEVQHGAVVSPR